ncbi:MAG: single-stranded-DNA-specific exonuclease RecJ [Lachnospiraceae bacterium]|nr:single-stranded-DNA-specific exonuclease RecJ [Lachnospiraceae bacterium]
MAKWFLVRKSGDFQSVAEHFGIDPAVARLLRNRGLVCNQEIEAYLRASYQDMHDPRLLGGVEEAVSLMKEALLGGRHIRVIGDYDVDGVCATFILQRGLKAFQAMVGNSSIKGEIDAIIPHRIRDGYGLNGRLIQEAIKEGVDLLITCDNGISALEEICMAKEAGIQVIVSDHHEIPFEERAGEKRYLLPEAEVIVDPKLPGDPYPFKSICGAVVAYKLMAVLLGFPEAPVSYDSLQSELLGFAAMATVCDVMALRGENRAIVKEGLKCLTRTPNLGMQALIRETGLSGRELVCYHMGFVLGPSVNACGRLGDAALALALFNAPDEEEAARLAFECRSLNESRKQLTDQGVAEAKEQILKMSLPEGALAADEPYFAQEIEQQLDKVLVVFLPTCHESVAGIVAGKLRETYNRPVFVLTRSQDGVKGSGRSIEAYNMHEHMSACRDLFTKFGGHAGAAGLSMKEEDIGEFRRRMNEGCPLTESDFERKLSIDMAMPLSYASLELAKQIERMEPFGTGNESPLFARKELLFLKASIMGKNRNVCRFSVQEEGNRFELILFRDLDRFEGFLDHKYGKGSYGELLSAKKSFLVSVAYSVSINVYKGRESLQLVMEDYC